MKTPSIIANATFPDLDLYTAISFVNTEYIPIQLQTHALLRESDHPLPKYVKRFAQFGAMLRGPTRFTSNPDRLFFFLLLLLLFAVFHSCLKTEHVYHLYV